MKAFLFGALFATAVFMVVGKREVQVLRDGFRLLYEEAVIG